MKSTFIYILFFLGTFSLHAQNFTCDEVMSFIKKEGYKKGSISSYQLIKSSWLKEVNAYTYDGDIYVIAKIKTDNYDYWGKEYIFCGIPSRNWSDFSGISFNQETYGEKFHKYIIDYVCNCK